MTEITKHKSKPHTEILQEIYKKALTAFNKGTFQQIFNQLDEYEKSNLQI